MITKDDLVAFATHGHHRDYCETGNGAHAWAAYKQARRLNAIPGWFVEYLDTFAEQVLAPGGTKNPETIARALGLFTARGGPSARTRAVKRKQEGAVRQRFALHRSRGRCDPDAKRPCQRARGTTVEEAISRVAATVGLSESRVRQIVYYKKLPK